MFEHDPLADDSGQRTVGRNPASEHQRLGQRAVVLGGLVDQAHLVGTLRGEMSPVSASSIATCGAPLTSPALLSRRFLTVTRHGSRDHPAIATALTTLDTLAANRG